MDVIERAGLLNPVTPAYKFLPEEPELAAPSDQGTADDGPSAARRLEVIAAVVCGWFGIQDAEYIGG
jgi:hypothetical protein